MYDAPEATSAHRMIPERYLTPEWRFKVIKMQHDLLAAAEPIGLSEEALQAWEIEWMGKFAPGFAAWLEENDRQHFLEMSQRLENGPPYTLQELKRMIDEIIPSQSVH